MVALLFTSAAIAASPSPDRPSISRTGRLVAPGTLELEVGGAWGEVRTLPALLKYSVEGVVEPRLGANLAGFDGGSPALEAGVKVRLVAQDRVALALYGASAIPVGAEDTWYGQLHGLLTAAVGGSLDLQVDGGVDLAEGGVTAIPIAGLLRASTGRLSGFAEAGAWFADDIRVVIDGGLGLRVTEILVVDAAGGWDFAAQAPFAKLGLTANLGRP